MSGEVYIRYEEQFLHRKGSNALAQDALNEVIMLGSAQKICGSGT